MVLYCTERFKQQVAVLEKNNSYSAIIVDICDYFKDKNIDELHITKDIIRSSTNKYRIGNSLSNKGKSSSYRCISGCYVKKDFLVLDTIYPKTGSDGIDNLSVEKYKEIAGNIKNAIESYSLYELDIELKAFSKVKK